MLTSLNWTLLQVIAVIVVGVTGTAEVAALSASRSITYVAVVLAVGLLTGVLVFVARADGARDVGATGAIFHQGLALALAVGVVGMLVLHFFAAPILSAIGVAPAVVPGGAAVVSVMAIGFPFQLVTIATSYFLEGVSRPRRVMAVNLLMLPVDVLLAWALADGHLGLPEMGAVGAAWATSITSVFGAAGLLIAAWTLPRARERGVRDLSGFCTRATMAGIGRLVAFGAMPAIAAALELAGFAILIGLSTQQGDAVAHAFQIVFSIHNLTFALALGFGSAAGVRVGNAVGEGRRNEGWCRAVAAAMPAAVATGTVALVLALGAPVVVRIFPAVGDVHLLAAMMLALWAPFILFDAIQVVLAHALRSLGDQVAAGAIGILSYFLVTGGAGLMLSHAGWGARGLALASGAGMVSAAALYALRLAWISCRPARLQS